MRLIALASALLFLNAGNPVAAAPPSSHAFQAVASTIVRREASSNGFSGTILIARRGIPIYVTSSGEENRETRTPNSKDTVFRIASTTKQFTAAAIMRLVEQHQIDLDAPVTAYYQEAPSSWKAVTIRDLLNHTSGIPDYTQTNGFIATSARLDLTPNQLLSSVIRQPLKSPPGSRFEYNNTDYVILGLIIEAVSRQSYSDFLLSQFFQPLSMGHTAYDDLSNIVPRRASGYLMDGKVARNAPFVATAAAFSAGGVRSTVGDLLIWDRALHAGRILQPSSVAAMFKDYGHGYGYGTFIDVRSGHRLWDHGGNLPGFSSAFEHYPDDGLTVVVLSNLDGEGAEKIAKELAVAYFKSIGR